MTDHLGTPSMLMTEAGQLAWKAQLDVYGVPREERGGVDEKDATGNPWRYPGQYEDKETGLYYNRFRYFDPESGRYVSEDPSDLRGGLPLFSYAPNPAFWIDPFGLDVCANNAAGKAAEQKAEDFLRKAIPEAEFLGRQVSIKTPEGRRVVDLLFRDAAGNIYAVEVKSGGAVLSAAQKAKDDSLRRGSGPLSARSLVSSLNKTTSNVANVLLHSL